MAYVKLSELHLPVLYVHQLFDQPWIYGIPSKKQARYQPVTYRTYWPVLGSYNNFNIINIIPKSTPFEAFDDIHHIILNSISDNMSSLVQSGMYGVTNTDYSTKMYFMLFNSYQRHIGKKIIQNMKDKLSLLVR